ncbi:MAG TPA: mersacidin/lichenicidin family type 2 lantibiotic, partial [Polyangiaceae bacterium]|nr:mersacidin/lichenicidin family type 2 lantibiotic [Polyangiaceae bacterium]
MSIAQMNADSSLIVRMWKDEGFRERMSAKGATSPAHPSGSAAVTLDVQGPSVYPTSQEDCTVD